MPTKHTLFRPSVGETKAAGTNAAAKRIIDDETAARDAKTRRLRSARLEREAAEIPEPAKPAVKKKAGR